MVRLLHEVAWPIAFILFYDRYWQGGVLRLMKNYHVFSIFSRFCLFLQVFGYANDWSILEVLGMIRGLHMVACPNIFILFYGRDWQGGVFKLMQNDNFLNIFISFGLFPHVFWQVNEWLISKLHKIIRVLHVFACPIILFCLMIQIGWEECSKLMKNDCFLVFLAVWVFSPKFLGRLRCHM